MRCFTHSLGAHQNFSRGSVSFGQSGGCFRGSNRPQLSRTDRICTVCPALQVPSGPPRNPSHFKWLGLCFWGGSRMAPGYRSWREGFIVVRTPMKGALLAPAILPPGVRVLRSGMGGGCVTGAGSDGCRVKREREASAPGATQDLPSVLLEGRVFTGRGDSGERRGRRSSTAIAR